MAPLGASKSHYDYGALACLLALVKQEAKLCSLPPFRSFHRLTQQQQRNSAHTHTYPHKRTHTDTHIHTWFAAHLDIQTPFHPQKRRHHRAVLLQLHRTHTRHGTCPSTVLGPTECRCSCIHAPLCNTVCVVVLFLVRSHQHAPYQ